MSIEYRGWSVWQTPQGAWCANDGRYSAQGAAMNGMQTLAALKARVDRYIASQEPK
jgi:hypothetical protein